MWNNYDASKACNENFKICYLTRRLRIMQIEWVPEGEKGKEREMGGGRIQKEENARSYTPADHTT